MPSKKTDKPEENKPATAPALPKKLLQQIKTDDKNSDTSSQWIPVRKASSTVATQPELAPTPKTSPSSAIDNPETDKAVDDIIAKESDMVLAIDDAMAAKRSGAATTKQSSWKDKLRSLIRNKWTWVGIAVVLCILFGLPFTRYRLLGLVLKEKVSVTVIDSQTHTPVSDALISTSGASVKTDANGTAKLEAGVGEHTLTITKKYYRTDVTHYFIGFRSNAPTTIKLLATGRLVPVTILNAISGKPLPGATIHVLGTSAKTNSKGEATVAVPASTQNDSATISLSGYNSKQASIQITNVVVPGNSFSLTPSGTIYFLSNQSGSIDVVKSNLDGSSRQTVLAGTGHEATTTTRLFVSHDWHYLVLEANRDGTRPGLYLISTSNGQVTEFDNSNASFSLIGWYGHAFLYSLKSNTISQWQSGLQVIKDYDADQQQLNQLDQNQAAGSSTSFAYQGFSNFFIVGDELVYDTQWTAQGGYDLTSSNDTIRLLQLSSQTKKDGESFPASTTGSIQASQYLPQSIYYAVNNRSDGSTSYYQYANQTLQTANIDQTTFSKTSPTYLSSPSGNRTVWSTSSNGQDIFSTGDSNAGSQQQIAVLDSYAPYGWYSDNYVLASRYNDELYILPASGLSASQQPLKITNYYEPAGSNSYYEYGGF